jgi:hypothetical protein
MKKILITFSSILAILLVLGFIFKAPLIELAKDVITHDMFIVEDTDDFDPGKNVGESFGGYQRFLKGG